MSYPARVVSVLLMYNIINFYSLESILYLKLKYLNEITYYQTYNNR